MNVISSIRPMWPGASPGIFPGRGKNFGDIIKHMHSKAYTMYSNIAHTMMKCTFPVTDSIKIAGDAFQTQRGESRPW